MFFFFFNDTATTEIYTLSLHDALPIYPAQFCFRWIRLHALPHSWTGIRLRIPGRPTWNDHKSSRFVQPTVSTGLNIDRKSTRLNSSHSQISYAVFCLKKKNKKPYHTTS